MIVACINRKGGVGKTTLAISLAIEGIVRKLKVLLVDGDPQGSVRTWAAIAAERGYPTPTVVAMGRTMHEAGQLDAFAGTYDLVVIDCPHGIDEVPASAMMIADLALLPTSPSGLDTWALAETLALVAKARTVRAGLRAAIVINNQEDSAIGRDVRQAVTGHGIPVLKAEIFRRPSHQTAITTGRGVSQYRPKSAAAAEIRMLFDELVTLGDTSDGETKAKRKPDGETKAKPRKSA